MAGFLKLLLSAKSVCMCACVCLLPRLLITSGMIWTLYDWLNKFYGLYTAAVVIIHSGCVIETNPISINQSCISHYFHYNNRLKQLYTSNKTECLGYKGGCGEHCVLIMCLKEKLA